MPVVKESAALGTALYAGVGAGIYSSIEEAVSFGFIIYYIIMNQFRINLEPCRIL
ncbi:hypothetical protein ACOQFO_16515 [Ureibacillus sp. MALMAid1270]|uniref:hypothetical protein n=1 Tax=Ureibacillus sp. MALMAid1270 TaxID=3411629 RepID=UPI003BA80ABF